MNNQLAQKCTQALKTSEYWTNKTRENGKTIQGLTCPACGTKGSAWAYSESPMSLNCNKLSTCGARTKTIEALNIKIDIEKENAPTKTDPNKPARAYLESRGLRNALKDLKYFYLPNVRGSRSGAVMLPVGTDSKGKKVSNGRVINPAPDQGKTHNIGSTSGQFWQHPGIEYKQDKPTYVTEGTFDGLSLIEIREQAIAALAAGQNPSKLNLSSFPKLVPAFDNDEAGVKATKIWLQALPSSKAIMPDKGMDWNDLLRSGPVEHVKAVFHANLPRYENNAQIACAESARKSAELYHNFHGRPPGLFEHNGCTYYAYLKAKGAESNLSVERVGKFTVLVRAFIDTGDQEKNFLYQLAVTAQKGQKVICTASGEQLATAKGLKAFFLSRAKVSYEAGANATTAFVTQIANSKAPHVKQVDHRGYNVQTGWYFFKDFAIDKEGKLHQPDANGLYRVAHNLKILPAAVSESKFITPSFSPKATPHRIYSLIHRAWGDNGAMALSWAVGSWFVNQIKNVVGFYPHLSLFGPPSCGKTNLTEKLQLLQAVDEEGITLSNISTKKGLARRIYILSGMFAALLEYTEENKAALGAINPLGAYNRGSEMSQAKFTADLQTNEHPLLCGLMFAQNVEPWTTPQLKQRAISLRFGKDALTPGTKAALDELNTISKNDLASFMVTVLQHRKTFESQWKTEYEFAQADLEEVQEERIKNNFALILGFHRVLCRSLSIQSEIFEHVRETALIKERTSQELEPNPASTFFTMVEASKSEQISKFWHVIEKPSRANQQGNVIYFEPIELARVLNTENHHPAESITLQKSFKEHPAYLKNNINHRFPLPLENNGQGAKSEQRKAWKFCLLKYLEVENPAQSVEKSTDWV